MDASILAHSANPPHTPASFLLVLLNANLLMLFPFLKFLFFVKARSYYANIAACGDMAGPTLIPMVIEAQKSAANILAMWVMVVSVIICPQF